MEKQTLRIFGLRKLAGTTEVKIVASLQERAKRIEADIMEHATSEKEKYLQEAADYKRRELEKAENEVLNESYEKIQDAVAEIRTRTAHMIAKKDYEAKRELFIKRMEMSDKVFAKVKEKLISYTKTPAYEERIAKSVKQLVEKYPLEGCELRFAPHDNVLAEKAAKAFGHGCTVAEDRDIVIGGFVLVHRGQGIYLDETLDSALEEQKTWFYQNSGLSID